MQLLLHVPWTSRLRRGAQQSSAPVPVHQPVQSLAHLARTVKALHRAAGTDPTPRGYYGKVHSPGDLEASAVAASRQSSAPRRLTALSVMKISCDHSNVPSWEVNGVQEVGRNLESPPSREGTVQFGVKYSNVVVLEVCVAVACSHLCGCTIADGSVLGPVWHFPKC